MTVGPTRSPATPRATTLRALVLGTLLAGLAPACLELETTRCEDGLLCPAGTQCFAGSCVFPEQIKACEGREDGAPCSYRNTTDGVCTGGVCVGAGCGNAVVEGYLGEVCDDGNVQGGDGCSANCRSDESCGNGVIDALASEECDCGMDDQTRNPTCDQLNSNEPGAVCTATCELHGCGDGVLREPEECDGDEMMYTACSDLGIYYSGELSCLSSCRFDTSGCEGWCGDGILNGPELCDTDVPPVDLCRDLGFDYGAMGCTEQCALKIDNCNNFGWRPVASADFEGRAITVTESGQLFACGGGGTVLHYDGESWEEIDTGFEVLLEDIHAVADDDVYAVGTVGTILHFDGQTWTSIDSGTFDVFTAVWASGADDVWIGNDDGLLLHYDGQALTQADPGPVTWIEGIWGTAPDDVFLVGFDGYIAHYDGNAWTQMTSNTTVELVQVWGTAPDDVYVTGFFGELLHYDGTTWTSIETQTNETLWSVGGKANDVMAGTTAIRYFDGSGWVHLEDAPDELFDMVQAPDGLYAIGFRGNVLRFTGLEWSPGTLGGEDYLSVWGLDHNDVYAVGSNGAIARYDYAGWQPMDSGTDAFLYGIWGRSPDDLLAVGDAGTLLHYDGESWSSLASPTNRPLRAIDGVDEGPTFAVGGAGTILRIDGLEPTLVGSGTNQAFNDVWVGAVDDAVAVGTSGEVVEYDGAVWTPIEVETTESLLSVWGDGDTVFAVGGDGTFLRRQDGAWGAVSSGTGEILRTVSGISTSDVFAAGTRGLILIDDGNGLAPANSPTDGFIDAVWADERAIFFLGEDGFAWKLVRVP